MGWLQQRRSRKRVEKILGKKYTAELTTELEAGMDNAEAVRDEMRKLESPEYGRLIETINSILDGTLPSNEKYALSVKLIKHSPLSEYEKNDLAQQVNSLYNKA